MGCRGKKRYEDEKSHNDEYYNFILACRMVQSSGIKIHNNITDGKGGSISPGRPSSRQNDRPITIALQGGEWSGLNWLNKKASDGHL
jgi:hypothetical protein